MFPVWGRGVQDIFELMLNLYNMKKQFIACAAVICVLFFPAFLKAQCGVSNWGNLISNDCGDLQPSGGLAAGSPTIFCEGQTVMVENNSTPMAEIQKTYIDWGDGSACQVFNGFQTGMTHIYDFPNDTCIKSNSNGTLVFPVRLGVEKTCGAQKSFNFVLFNVVVRFKPVADFTANPQAACVSTEIDFTNTSCENSNSATFLWNMGNGQTFTTENVANYVYPGGGTFNVTMTVTNVCGSDDVTKTISVLPPATANASLSAPRICAGQTVTFTQNSTHVNSYRWTITPSSGVSFVQPTNSSSPVPIIRFNNGGNYTIRMQVNGCGNPEQSFQVEVVAPASVNIRPIADACASGVVSVMPTATISGDAPTIMWEFPGGTPGSSTSAVPGTVTYPAEGSYIVTAIASNFCGTATDRDTFVIAPAATAAFTTSATDLCGPDGVLTLTNGSTNGMDYTWTVTPGTGFSYANNTNSKSTNPQLTFSAEGTYTIQLRVNACGDPVATRTVTVRLKPTVQLADTPDGCEPGRTLSPGNLATFGGGAAASTEWTFLNGSVPTASGASPGAVTFNGPGVYGLSVTVANQCGTATAVDSFRLISPDAVAFPAVPALCSADSPRLLRADPAGGTWTGQGVTAGGVFDPAKGRLNQPTLLVYSIGAGTCLVRDTLEVLVRGTVVNAGMDRSVCANSGVLTLNGFSPTGGQWSGDHVSPAGIFMPQNAGNGAHFSVYTFKDTTTGCVNRDTLVVEVLGVPAANLDSIGRICTNTPFDFGAFAGTTAGTSCRWTFGDGQSSGGCQSVHTYTAPGVYPLTLIVQNNAQCQDTAYGTVRVVSPPDAAFTTDVTKGCADLPVYLEHQSSLNDYTIYIWEYGNGQRDTAQQPRTPVVFTQGEKDTVYTIRLRAVNGCGTATAQKPVTVFPRPQVRFGTDFSNGCSPLEINFNNVSAGNPDYYHWYVNGVLRDTQFQLAQQVFYAFKRDSVHFIRLVAGNECGMDTVEHTITVRPNPVRSFFNTDTLTGCQPFEVRLIDYSTQGVFIKWDFGDGTTAVGDTVSHIFNQPGQFVLRNFANNGCGFDTSAATVTVLPAPPVSFTHAPFVCLGDTLFLKNTSPAIAGSVWQFGDGSADSTHTSVGHVYKEAGQYVVAMTGFAAVTGCPATATGKVEVKPLPVPEVRLSDSAGCAPLLIRPQNNTPGNSNAYVWDFGDGTTRTGADGQHLYPEAGTYTLRLHVTDFFQCKNTWTFTPIQVYPNPEPDFRVTQTVLCTTPTTLQFENLSREADAYRWNFGTPGTSEAVQPVLTVTVAGTLDIGLLAINRYGCRDSLVRRVRIYTRPDLNFKTDKQIGCTPYTAFFENNSTGVNLFRWDFGDGGTSSEQAPRHRYTTPGVYTVTLYASADSVCFDSLRLRNYITVRPSPTARFTAAPVVDTTVVPNGIFRFKNESLNAIRWRWDFGDGDTSILKNPTHRYFTNGPQVVTLIAYNDLECPDTAMQTLTPEFFGRLYIPNALSPDHGVADERIFKAVGVGLAEFSIAVYGFNGQRVWHSTALEEGQPSEEWNGRLHNTGDPLPQGLYVWKAFARFADGRIWPGMATEGEGTATEGKVLLIR